MRKLSESTYTQLEKCALNFKSVECKTRDSQENLALYNSVIIQSYVRSPFQKECTCGLVNFTIPYILTERYLVVHLKIQIFRDKVFKWTNSYFAPSCTMQNLSTYKVYKFNGVCSLVSVPPVMKVSQTKSIIDRDFQVYARN